MRRVVVAFVLVLALAALLFLWKRGAPGGSASRPDASRPSAQSLEASLEPSPAVPPAADVAPSAREAGTATDRAARADVGGVLDAELLVRVRCRTEGIPVPDALVYPDSSTVPSEAFWRYFSKRPARTDARGEARIPIPADMPLDVQIRPVQGWKPAAVRSQPVSPGSLGELTVELDSTSFADFCGRVLDAATKAPIAGATITLPEGAAEASLATDGEGRFCARYDIRVVKRSGHIESEGYAEADFVLDAEHPTPAHARVFSLSRSATVRALVVRPDGPAEGERVRIEIASPSRFGNFSSGFLESATDAGGLATFSDIPVDAKLKLHVMRSGSPARTERIEPVLAPGETRQVRFTIGDGVDLAGVLLVDDAAPLPGYEVTLEFDLDREFSAGANREGLPGTEDGTAWDRQSVTDQQGRFAFSDVLPGAWVVRTSKQFTSKVGPVSAAAVALEVRPSERAEEIVLRVYSGISIHGRVVDTRGNPVDAVEVDAQFVDGSPEVSEHETSTGRSRADGTFVLEELRPGRYWVWARSNQGESKATVATAGASGIELRLEPSGSIEGRVYCGDGVEEYGSVWAVTEDGERVGANDSVSCDTPSISSDVAHDVESQIRWDGARQAFASRGAPFELKPLAPGRYTVFASTHDGGFARQDGIVVSADQVAKGVELRLERGGRLGLRYDGTVAYVSYEIRVNGERIEAGLLRWGSWIERTVPLGSAVVAMTDDESGRNETRTVSIVPGERAEIAFDWRKP